MERNVTEARWKHIKRRYKVSDGRLVDEEAAQYLNNRAAAPIQFIKAKERKKKEHRRPRHPYQLVTRSVSGASAKRADEAAQAANASPRRTQRTTRGF